MNRERRRRVASNSALLLGSTAVAILLVEMGFRVWAQLQYRGTLRPELQLPADPLPGTRVTLAGLIRRSTNPRRIYELRPRLNVVYEGAVVTTNDRGFRGSDPGPERRQGTFRIVGLGDSFLFGQGVGDGETHLALLERSLDERTGRACDVVNIGVPGYNAAMEVEAFKDLGLSYAPDLVLVEFVGNDLDLPNFIAADPRVLSPARCFLCDLVRSRLHRRTVPDDGLVPAPRHADDPGLFESGPGTVPDRYRDLVGWPAVERAYRELHALGRGRGFRIALLVWDAAPTQGRLGTLARKLDIPTLDLGRVAQRAVDEHGWPSWEDSPLVCSRVDNHPSALGHRVTSEAVLRFLIEKGLVPGGAG